MSSHASSCSSFADPAPLNLDCLVTRDDGELLAVFCRKLGSLGSVSTPTKDRLLWRSLPEAQMVLFEVKWLERQQRGTTAFQERYSSRSCGIFFQTLVQEYDMRLAIQCSSILSILFEIKLSNTNCVNRHRGSVG